jgi:hypothetical protein
MRVKNRMLADANHAAATARPAGSMLAGEQRAAGNLSYTCAHLMAAVVQPRARHGLARHVCSWLRRRRPSEARRRTGKERVLGAEGAHPGFCSSLEQDKDEPSHASHVRGEDAAAHRGWHIRVTSL